MNLDADNSNFDKLENLALTTVDVGDGPVLLFVHGFPLDHSMWQHQIQDLATDYRVIAPDLPGFGLSEPVSEPVSLGDYADSLDLLLEQLGVDQPVTYCGLSMGGYIGWQFLQRYPARVSSLIACDTRTAADNETTARGRRVMASQVRVAGSGSIAAEMIHKLCCQHTLDTMAETVQQQIDVIAQTDPNNIAAAQLAMADRPDATTWLDEIQVPTLFVAGEEDTITPPAEMKAMADRVPNSQFVELTNAGHLAPLENPQDFNKVLRDFLTTFLAAAP